jgi:hypothetical protein
MFFLKPCEPPVPGAKLVLNGMRMCGFDEPTSYELLTGASTSPFYIDVKLSREGGDADSRTTIGRIIGNRLAITVLNPSATVMTTNQARHQIVYLAEKNLQLTFAFCCVPIAAGKYLFYHEFYEEPFKTT